MNSLGTLGAQASSLRLRMTAIDKQPGAMEPQWHSSAGPSSQPAPAAGATALRPPPAAAEPPERPALAAWPPPRKRAIFPTFYLQSLEDAYQAEFAQGQVRGLLPLPRHLPPTCCAPRIHRPPCSPVRPNTASPDRGPNRFFLQAQQDFRMAVSVILMASSVCNLPAVLATLSGDCPSLPARYLSVGRPCMRSLPRRSPWNCPTKAIAPSLV